MNTALFSFRKEQLPKATLLTGKPELFDKLRQREIDPRISLNGEAAFDASSVETHELLDENTVQAIGAVALEEVGVIVNRLDRSFKMDQMPTTWQQAMPPIENENAMRSLVFRKHRVQNELFEPLGLGMPTRLVESYLDVDAFLHEHPASAYIAKPTSGTFSKNIHRLAPSDVGNYFADNGGFGETILQPAYDFSLPLPNTLRPYDEASREAFDTLSASDLTKELRMYSFYSPQNTTVFPVARAMKDGEDKWFFVDPESLPETLVEDTKKVISRAALLTGSKAVYAALDIGYGSLDNGDPQYHAIELNGRMPYMIGYDKHHDVADTLREHFADQVQDTINDSKGIR